jgi:hypothetical protein
MPRIRFTADFDFKVNPRVIRAYKALRKYLVSQACADAAIAAGKAELVDRSVALPKSSPTSVRRRARG